eukprot:c28380_g1_i1 orf=183-3803(+)
MAASPGMDVPNSPSSWLNSAIAFDVEISDSNGSTVPVPDRVRRRLENAENRGRSPASLQEIETKLKEAELRRQQFHEWLANKARPKLRSSYRPSQPDDLAQRLEAKLVAAEQKRLELLAQEQTRLARLHESRVAARTEVQLRAEKEREELGSKVELRVQQAESKRLALLEVERQRWAAAHERMALSILHRTAQEGKHQERIKALRAMICQKIAAAEEKRAGLLKAEKNRAQAIVLQARKVARSVLRKRELELRIKKQQLEARLQKAKGQRTEYLRQRGGCRGACHNNGHKMHKHGDRLCRKLTRCWRQFLRSRRTTYSLAQEFAACAIDQQSVTSLPFEELAGRITSPTSLHNVKALLARIESRFMLSSASHSNVAKIDHLLKRLFPSKKKTASLNASRSVRKSSLLGSNSGAAGRSQVTVGASIGKVSQKIEDKDMERYPARVFLCAYMIIGHPDAVFSSQGEREAALSEAATKLIHEFEALVSTILDGPSFLNPQTGSSPPDLEKLPPNKPFATQLAVFDSAWCSYLYQFVAWKVQDAQLLEEDLIRVACQLEVSMLQKCKVMSGEDGTDLSHDSQAIRKQVLEDQQLLCERLSHLTGSAGVARMEAAVSDARMKFMEARERGSPLPSPFLSPLSSRPANSPLVASPFGSSLNADGKIKPKVARALFSNCDPKVEEESESIPVSLRDFSNESLVNEMLHEPNWLQSDAGQKSNKTPSNLAEIQAQIKATMENAFWNGIMDGLVKEPPEYGRIVGLLKEVRDELVTLAPESWKQELHDSLDLEIFSQLLSSGSHDYDYFHRMLDYALNIVLRLGAPARDEDARGAQEVLFQELSDITSLMGERNSFVYALVKGLRFVLEQVQLLKADISATRIHALASFIQGTAGVEYLQNSFARCYEVPVIMSSNSSWSNEPSDLPQKLPKTIAWLNIVAHSLEQERQEVESSLMLLRSSVGPDKLSANSPSLPSMRTGGRVITGKEFPAMGVSWTANSERRVVQWKSGETFVRLGLLNFICGLEPVTEENVVETFKLNVQRLRKGQNDFQRIVVIATGLLLLRQCVADMEVSATDLQDVLKRASDRLNVLLDQPSVTVSQMGSLLAEISAELDHQHSKNLGTNSELMTQVLNRSLSPDDSIFIRVSASLRVGLRAMLLIQGTDKLALAKGALQRIGATCLLDLLVTLASDLEGLATVSWLVHKPWYEYMISEF